MTQERWTPRRLDAEGGGKREGWWGASAAAEAFLDELVTWRELGYNMCHARRLRSLRVAAGVGARDAGGARARPRAASLHAANSSSRPRRTIRCGTPRSTSSCARAACTTTCACCGARRFSSGRATPRDALETMIHLNNKYALDGRDPNSYSGIFWVLGRYDRAWGPERADLRHSPLHEQREHRAETARQELHRQVLVRLLD